MTASLVAADSWPPSNDAWRLKGSIAPRDPAIYFAFSFSKSWTATRWLTKWSLRRNSRPVVLRLQPSKGQRGLARLQSKMTNQEKLCQRTEKFGIDFGSSASGALARLYASGDLENQVLCILLFASLRVERLERVAQNQSPKRPTGGLHFEIRQIRLCC